MIKRVQAMFLGGVLILAMGLGLFNSETFAVSQSMRVSPRNQKLILIPGEKYSDSITISNENDSTRDLKYGIAVGSFSENGGENGIDDYGNVDHVSVSNYNQMMDWISFDKESGTVPPNTSDKVTYTIDVPENAPAGGQYATIIVKDETDKDASDNGNVAVQSTFQYASIIYAEVAGESVQSGKILENNIPTISFSTPLTVSSMVENSGNVHTDASYTLEVRSLFSDDLIYSNDEDEKTSLILPETKRYHVQEWKGTPMIGIFKVKQIVEIFDDVSTVEKVVLICPIWLMLIVLFLIIAMIIWLVARSRARRGFQD